MGVDFVPIKSNMDLFISGDEEKSIIKQRSNLISPTEAVKGNQTLGVNLLILAINHILAQDV